MTIIKAENLETAKEKFAELQQFRELMNDRTTAAIAPSRLYAYVAGRKDDELAQALKTQLGLRRAYRDLLKRMSYFHMPQALAASTDDYPTRHCEGCVIRLQASRAQSDQLYLIIELSDQRGNMPQSLSVFGSDEACETLDLPPARNGVIQTIIDKNSPLARLLGDPKTEIFLR
ncbi:hypothetical protein MTBPR1_90114 [Candidatus Terasakiella magnetica]|uniref:Uncharacterized protein n=1 Tax=Candidatus Terasakiella magnetica TaxID=1867952 RepID=A0A1C3RLU6_9PROT|nr:hypothetical protein [Candidatus Terasakiella magnetica]SCA58267.1 hypothetical protein MTBPR1_90114 [Candidatus Terasakiella magnetica]